MVKAFEGHKVIVASRQAPSLRNILIRSRFDLPQPTPPINRYRIVGLFKCLKCVYCTGGLFDSCTSFRFGRYDQFNWSYNRKFTCNSFNVIYLVKCNYCWKFYIGETRDTKKRVRKHKSDVYHPENSKCRLLSEHLGVCSSLTEPFFQLFPFFYEDDDAKRKFLEKRYIAVFKPPLNSNR